jgi:hypothetical protein
MNNQRQMEISTMGLNIEHSARRARVHVPDRRFESCIPYRTWHHRMDDVHDVGMDRCHLTSGIVTIVI